MTRDVDTWPLPEYHPGPSDKHLHALGVIALTYATLQRDVDDLFLQRAVKKAVPREWAEKYYYSLTEDRRTEAVRAVFQDADPDLKEAIDNVVCFFDWCRHCRNNLLHAEGYPIGLGRLPGGASALTKRKGKSSQPVYMALTLKELRDIADHVREGVVQCATIHLFMRYAGQSVARLPQEYQKYAAALPPKLAIPRKLDLALTPEELRKPKNV